MAIFIKENLLAQKNMGKVFAITLTVEDIREHGRMGNTQGMA